MNYVHLRIDRLRESVYSIGNGSKPQSHLALKVVRISFLLVGESICEKWCSKR